MYKSKQRFLIITIAVLSIVPAYKLKTRLGVNLLPGGHTPSVVEKWTGGLIKAKWIDRNYIRRPQNTDASVN